MNVQWHVAASVAANTAYTIPTAAGLPATAYVVGARNLVIAPLATAGTASTASAINEVSATSATNAPAAGYVSVDILGQKLYSGDNLPAGAVVLANLILAGDQPNV